MPTAGVNGTQLFYQETGAGTPCLVMHGGLGMDHTYLHPTLDPLGDDLRLIYYDHRGNGRSARHSGDELTLDQWVADADALRAHVGVERVAVLGHSFGGCIGLEYALRFPARVSHLLLIDTIPALNYWDEIDANIARRQPSASARAAWGSPPTDDAGLANWLASVGELYVHPQSDPDLLATVMARTTFAHAAWARSVEVFNHDYDVTGRLGEITVPTLIVVGREDFVCPPSQAAIMRDRIASAEMAVFERSGHFPFVEEPDAFFSTVREWLARVS